MLHKNQLASLISMSSSKVKCYSAVKLSIKFFFAKGNHLNIEGQDNSPFTEYKRMHFDCSAHHNNRDVLCLSTFIYSITNLRMITSCEQRILRSMEDYRYLVLDISQAYTE